jgi:Ferritin-like domain
MASKEIEVLDPEVTVEKLKKIATGRALNRRHFLAALGMTGAAAGAALLSGCDSTTSSGTTPVTPPTIGQTDVLNFALNLEFLEATFYSFITQGADLPSSVLSGSGAVTGSPAKLTFTGTNATQITDMFNEIYYDELNHVKDLQSILGILAIPRPAINLAALGAVTATNAISISRQFEDVGITAYAGALASLSSTSLAYATQILAVEGFHSGYLRLVTIQNPTIAAYLKADSVDVAPFDPGTAALAAAGPTASGGFFTTAGASSATAATPAGFAFTRTTSQVLAILYSSTPGTPAPSGTKSGGFFPSGVNGIINTV